MDNQILDQSLNAKLVVAGLAYVEPYDTMPTLLVQHLRALVHEVRNSNRGLCSDESVTIDNAGLIKSMIDTEALIMRPKLFRRLTTYFDEGYIGLGQFDAWIRDDPIRRDDTLRLPDGEKGNMHDTYLIDNDKLQLQFRPEDLLITPDPNATPA